MLPDFLKTQKFNCIVVLYFLLPALLFGQEASSEQNRHVIAVLKFKNNTDVFAYDRLETNIPEMLKTELSQYNKLVVVERENIENIVSEQVLSLSGVMDD